MRYRIYLASPFFNDEQLKRVKSIEESIVRNGFELFSPRLESLVGEFATKEQRSKAFQLNLESINRADFVLAVTDGKDVGTMFECGYAYARGVPIIYFAETLGDKPFNLMLAESTQYDCIRQYGTLNDVLKEISEMGLDSFLSSKEGYDGRIE